MAENLYTAVTKLAVAFVRSRDELEAKAAPAQGLFERDPILEEMFRRQVLTFFLGSEIAECQESFLCEAEFSAVAPDHEALDPMIIYHGGGARVSLGDFPRHLLAAALVQAYLLGLPEDEGTLARLMLEGLEELKRGIRGEQVRCLAIHGLGGITFQKGTSVATPWGVLRPAPEAKTDPWSRVSFGPATTAIVTSQRLAPVLFDRAPQPELMSAESLANSDRRASLLMPLSCALASVPDEPAAPTTLWSTEILPFLSAVGYSSPSASPNPRVVDLTARAQSIEDWSRIIEEHHHERIDISAQRVVTAIARRLDLADSLIDAVTVWENLVGSRSETVFRVTAALTLLLCPEPNNRQGLRKELQTVYDRRSRVVHGDVVSAEDVAEASQRAVRTALEALRISYRRGGDWLAMKSSQRADHLILGDAY